MPADAHSDNSSELGMPGRPDNPTVRQSPEDRCGYGRCATKLQTWSATKNQMWPATALQWILQRARSLLKPRFFRYLLAGGTAFVVDYATFFAAQSLAGFDIALSQALARAGGAIAGFFLHKYFVFRNSDPESQNRQSHHTEAFRQGLGYTILTLTNVALSAALAGILGRLAGSLPIILPKLATDVFMVAETYALLHLVFRRKREV